MLKRKPDKMIKSAVVPKNMHRSFQFITFLSSVASGSDRPTTAIMNAIAVPIGMPFATKTSIMGTIPAALEYIGTASSTAAGTAKRLSFER